MSGNEGTSVELPTGLAFCQYCRTIATDAAPQRFLSWRTKGTSSQTPGSVSAFGNTTGTRIRVHTNSSGPALGDSLFSVGNVLDGNGGLAKIVNCVASQGTWLSGRPQFRVSKVGLLLCKRKLL